MVWVVYQATGASPVTPLNISAFGYAEARAVVSYLVQKEEYLSLTELSKHLRRDLSALSRGVGRIRERLRENDELAEKISSLEEN